MADPVSVLKVSVFFSMQGEGWSEVYFVKGTDPWVWINGVQGQSSFALGSQKVLDLLSSRGGMLPRTAGIVHVRASLEGSPRIAAGRSYGSPGYQGTWPISTLGGGINLNPWTRLLTKLTSRVGGNKVAVNHFFGGLPFNIQNENAQWNGSANFIKAIDAFAGWMTGVGGVSRSRPSAATATTITAFNVNADGLSATVAPNVLGNIVGTKGLVTIRRVKNPHGWNGTHSATVIDNPTVGQPPIMVIGPTRKPMATVPVWNAGAGGTVQAQVYVYNDFADFLPQKFVKKSTGRPFAESVGRRTRP